MHARTRPGPAGPLGPADPLPYRPRRILVAGTSGSGKSTLARALAERLGVPYHELDALYHGPGWVPRPEFAADVAARAATPAWVSEWQYSAVRALLLSRADLLVWLDLTRRQVARQLVPRTVRRRRSREELWNGNVEPPLWTVLTDRDHLLRWAWRTHPRTAERVGRVLAAGDGPPVVRLRGRADVARWLAGPVSAVAGTGGGGDPGQCTPRSAEAQ
ncbi:MAG: (d)CMP kinase [Pseudonocardiales bacterium]|jgi:adenylate kinase family enzyme|nr:(d)CMP kinase [Pseudonocardiales bacterium]